MSEMHELAGFMDHAIGEIIDDAWKASYSCRERIFLLRCLLDQRRLSGKRKKNKRRGISVPPFLIASIASDCNLFCTGCYARANGSCGESQEEQQLSADRWGELFSEADELGVGFVLLAGGEPFMRREVIEKAGQHKRILFPLFTNGTMFGDGDAEFFARHRNLIPLFSMEGLKRKTDDRRGEGIFQVVTAGMNALKGKKVLFGASITVKNDNIDEVTSEDFLTELHRLGCRIVLYVEYVPALQEKADLTLNEQDRAVLEQRIKDHKRSRNSMVFLSFPGDEKKVGGCLAAGRGFFHISPDGNAEPCPFSPFSDRNVRDHSLEDVLSSPFFQKLRESGLMQQDHGGGCALFGSEDRISKLLVSCNASRSADQAERFSEPMV